MAGRWLGMTLGAAAVLLSGCGGDGGGTDGGDPTADAVELGAGLLRGLGRVDKLKKALPNVPLPVPCRSL